MVKVAHFNLDFIATVVTVELSTLNYLNSVMTKFRYNACGVFYQQKY